jgi:hypothetical protein
MMPGVSVEVETDLWFSPLVQTRGARTILFYPDVAERLREQLGKDQGDLERAWKLVRETHSYLPDLVRLEEELTWLAIADNPLSLYQIEAK